MRGVTYGAHNYVWIHAMWQCQVDSSNITFDFIYGWQELVNGEIQPLLMKKNWFKFKTLRKSWLWNIYGICIKFVKKNQTKLRCHWSDLETLGSLPILSKFFPFTLRSFKSQGICVSHPSHRRVQPFPFVHVLLLKVAFSLAAHLLKGCW